MKTHPQTTPTQPKKTRGGAYVIVVGAFSFVLATVLVLLTITAASRNTTASYGDFYGMYDIAVAATEQAFNALKNGEPQKNEWELSIDFPDYALQDTFTTSTIITDNGYEILIETQVTKQNSGGETQAAATVHARALRHENGSLAMTGLYRVAG